MTAALLIFAFTAGLVLSPAVGKLVRHIQLNVHNRKVGKAFRLLEDEGYAVHARDDWAVCKTGSG